MPDSDVDRERATAPCVAVVGPASSGKSTLLEMLDRTLARLAPGVLAYQLPGNPDGVGKYVAWAPRLREELKPFVKGRWSPGTVDIIGRWIDAARDWLQLVVVDFGGKRSAENMELYRHCSHYLVVARHFTDPGQEEREGLAAWVADCSGQGLEPIALLDSRRKKGEPLIERGKDGVLRGMFRSDLDASANLAIIEGIAKEVLHLPLPAQPGRSYLTLDLGRDWGFEDLGDLGGRGVMVNQLVERGGPLAFGAGGRKAPIWAYCRAMHRALDRRPEVAVDVFDPKIPGGYIRIPARSDLRAPSGLDTVLAASWEPRQGAPGTTLHVKITTTDRLLPDGYEELLASIPVPEEAVPLQGPLIVSGRLPIAVHLAYSRRLRSKIGGSIDLGVWDARTEQAMIVHGPSAPRVIPWPATPRP